MSEIKSEPTPEQAKQAQLEQERSAGQKDSDSHVNPRNGRDSTSNTVDETAGLRNERNIDQRDDQSDVPN